MLHSASKLLITITATPPNLRKTNLLVKKDNLVTDNRGVDER